MTLISFTVICLSFKKEGARKEHLYPLKLSRVINYRLGTRLSLPKLNCSRYRHWGFICFMTGMSDKNSMSTISLPRPGMSSILYIFGSSAVSCGLKLHLTRKNLLVFFHSLAYLSRLCSLSHCMILLARLRFSLSISNWIMSWLLFWGRCWCYRIAESRICARGLTWSANVFWSWFFRLTWRGEWFLVCAKISTCRRIIIEQS